MRLRVMEAKTTPVVPPLATSTYRQSVIGAFAAGCLSVLAITGMGTAAKAVSPDAKPYDDKLLRLSELLGAVHYLRELCGANDGQLWRDRMKELMDAEGSSALRRAKLTRSFNQGYHSYSRTYKACTSSAQTAIARFMAEAAQIAEGLLARNVP
jgi:uncharacterized protein (TIGR02301 family)